MSTDQGAFKAILWKEFRENFKWAVLGLQFVSAATFSLLYTLRGQSSDGGDLNWNDLSNSLFRATPYITPVVGLMIGVAQVIFENRGDSWGFLTHRPMKRSTLFWGKAAAGMTLYFIVVSVPFLGAIIWAAIPGHLPMPLDVRMVLPLIADVLCGAVYYFAGLLTGMREARWYASRVMGVGIGIVCSTALFIVPEFWQAATCCALGILISAASAWGAFVEGGRFASQPRLTRFTTALSIGCGLLITGAVVFSMAESFVRVMEPVSKSTRHQITSDGAIVQVDYDGDAIVEVRDLQGRPVERYQDPEARLALNRGVVASETISPSYHFTWNGDYRNTSEFFRPFHSSDVQSNGRTFTWYYISRLGRFAAYENKSAELIGWMGPGGFISGPSLPEDRFERPMVGNVLRYEPTLIAFEDAVYRMDLRHRHIEKIFAAHTGESIIGASDSEIGSSSPSTAEYNARFTAIFTTNRVVIQSRDNVVQLSAPRDGDSHMYGSVIVFRSLGPPESQTFIWYTNGYGTQGLVTQYGSNSAPMAQYTLLSQVTFGTLTWSYALLRSARENLAMRTLMGKRSNFNTSSLQVLPGQRLASWLIPIFEGVLFAGLALARGRRYAFSTGRLVLWTGIGFALGPLGFALMLALLEWPAFEKCSECGLSRLVTLESCEHCSKPFRSPDIDGTEVFEPI